MEYFISFLIALASLYFIKKFWTAVLVGAGIFVIVHFISLSVQAPVGSTMNIQVSTVSRTIGEALGIFTIPFIGAMMIYGFFKRLVKQKDDDLSTK